MRWPWHSPAAPNAWRVGIEHKLELLEHHVRSGHETMAERLELLDQLPRMARQVAKTSAIVAEWQEKREGEVEEMRRLRQAVDVTVHQLMQWVDELSVVMQKTGSEDAWRGVHGTWLRQAEVALAEMGYVEVPVLGRVFDAKVAEAVGTVAFTGAAPPTPSSRWHAAGTCFRGSCGAGLK